MANGRKAALVSRVLSLAEFSPAAFASRVETRGEGIAAACGQLRGEVERA